MCGTYLLSQRVFTYMWLLAAETLLWLQSESAGLNISSPRCVSFLLTQLQQVWSHVCLGAISASRYYPAQLGVKFLSYRFKGDFLNFREQCSILSCLTQVFRLSLTSQASLCQRHLLRRANQGSVGIGGPHAHAEAACKALVCIERAACVRQMWPVRRKETAAWFP